MNKKGFTLFELLAVIVILGILLVISIPKFANITSISKEKLFKEQKLRLEEATKKYINEIYISSTEKYKIITLSELQEEGYIDEIKDVYDESKTCSAFVTVTNLDMNPLISTYIDCNNNIEEMATYTIASSGNMKADDTIDANLRYSGGDGESVTTDDVPNYVTFNGEKWRIIGIFNVSNGDIIEPRIKLIRNESLGNYSWDTSPSTANTGYGYNIWETKEGQTKEDGTTKADINILLNELYYDGENITCYCGINNTIKECPQERLNSNAKEMIENTVWNLGGNIYSNTIEIYSGLPTLDAYNKEKNINVYFKNITKTKWTGRVGLIYPSDYGYASINNECRKNMRAGIIYEISGYNYSNTKCKINNWLNEGNYWTISPYAELTTNVFIVREEGVIHENVSYNTWLFVRPVVYLKSNIKITSGNGSYDTPYQLSF